MGRAPNWAARSFYTDQASPVHQASPDHFGGKDSRGSVDPGAASYQAPPIDVANAIELGYVAESDDSWAFGLETDGFAVDATPRTHESGAALETYGDDAGLAAAQNAAHSYDQGASLERNRATGGQAPLQFADETYIVTRFDGLPAVSYVEPINTRRGLNGLPENNPDGFPLGMVEQVWVDRKFAAVVARNEHDARIVTVNTAEGAVNQPLPAGVATMGAPFQPFASLARPITNISQRPQLRREQPGITEALLTDDVAYADADSGEWVAG